MKFICDDNLGKLARYLRALGFDIFYENDIENSRLIQIALDEKRIILTRDNKLKDNSLIRNLFIISDDYWPKQIKSVIDNFQLKPITECLFTRCMDDNTETIEVSKQAVEKLLYPYTFSHFNYFRQCPECKKVYWQGSHVKKMRSTLASHGISIRDASE